MKKIWIFALLIFLPTILLSQPSNWSINASVGAGISKADNPSTKFYKNDSKGKIGTDLSVTVRYSFLQMFFVSSGIGFQAFKSQCGYTMNSSAIDYNGLKPDLSYSNIYFPFTVGFSNSERWRLYPVAELGAGLNFATGLKDKVEIGSVTTDVVGKARVMAPSFIAQGGVGYLLSYKVSLEAKLRYVTVPNVSDDMDVNNKAYKSTWMFMGGQLSLLIRL